MSWNAEDKSADTITDSRLRHEKIAAALDFGLAVEKGVKRVAVGLSLYERFGTLAEECGGHQNMLTRRTK